MQIRRQLTARFLQEYLEAVALCAARRQADDPAQLLRLMSTFAELQYKMRGGSKCAICRAHVRHVMQVHSERAGGGTLDFSCLCIRCLEAEKAFSAHVLLRFGNATVDCKSLNGAGAAAEKHLVGSA